MTGKWKKAAAVLLAAVMAVLLVPLPTYAKETAKISVGSGSCDIGDEVTISVSVSSSVDIYMCDIWLSYDSGVLQPVSGYSGGGGGVCVCSLLTVPHSACGLKQYRREVLRFL